MCKRFLCLVSNHTWWALLWVLELLHAFYPTPCALVSGNTQGQNRYMLPKVPWRNKKKPKQNKTNIHSYFTHLKRDKCRVLEEFETIWESWVLEKRVLETLSGQSVWKPHGEPFWTQEQYASSTTYCCIDPSEEQAPELWPYAAQTCCYSCRHLFQLYHVKSLFCLCRSVSIVSSGTDKDCKCVRPWRVVQDIAIYVPSLYIIHTQNKGKHIF